MRSLGPKKDENLIMRQLQEYRLFLTIVGRHFILTCPIYINGFSLNYQLNWLSI